MKRTLTTILALVLVAAISVGATLAFVRGENKNYINVFSSGENVNVEVWEVIDVEGDGATVTETSIDANTVQIKYEGVMPGDYLKKQLNVKNNGADAYVKIDVTITNYSAIKAAIDNTYAGYGYGKAAINAMYDYIFKGWNIDSDFNVLKLADYVLEANTSAVVDDKVVITYYLKLAKDQSTILYEGIEAPEEFTYAQLGMFDGLEINVAASAIQADNLTLDEAKQAFENTNPGYGDPASASVWDGAVPAEMPETLVVDGDTQTVHVKDAAAFAYLSTLSAKWVDLYTDGNGTTYTNYANGAGGNYYYSGQWTVSLDANLDLSNHPIAPVNIMFGQGTGATAFNGNGHYITNINTTTGLFADGTRAHYVNLVLENVKATNGALAGASNSSIDRVTVINASISGEDYVGGLVGKTYSSVTNCRVIDSSVVATGKEAGGLIGYAEANSKGSEIANNVVRNVSVYANNRAAGLVAQPNVNIEVYNNTVDTVNVGVEDNSKYQPGAIASNALQPDNVKVEDNTVKNAKVYTNSATATDNSTLNDAIAGGADTVFLGSGDYVIPSAAKGQSGLTFVGTGDTSVAVTKVGTGGENCDYGLDGSTVTFENITITTNSSTYIGYARCNATYNNCTINGTYTLYGDSEFNNCEFNVSGDVYNIWTWGAPKATFNGCTFNNDGKAMLLYGTANTVLSMNNCVFNDNGDDTVTGKAAIEIGNDYNKSYQLIVNNCKANGYAINPNGINTNTTLWANKNSMAGDKLLVVVDGVKMAYAKDNATLESAISTGAAKVYLVPGVNYGTVYLGRPTKSNDTVMVCDTHSFSTSNAEEFKAHLNDGQYHTTPRYTTTLKNLTVIGAEGATVEGLVVTSGHAYGDVYDYVLDKDYASGSAYYNTLNLENISFEKVNFTGKIDINTSDATSVYDGITFDTCTFTTGGTASANGAAIRYYNEANNGNVKNIVVKDCKFNNCYQGIYVHHVNGITVTGSTFDTTGHNAIALQGHDGAVDLKNVVITGNTFKNIGDRIIRFNVVGADSNITIQGNVATNSGDDADEVMKATSIETGIKTSISNNTWNGTVVNDELKDK